MFFRYSDIFFWLLLPFFETVQEAYSIIKGPTDLKGYIGENANFIWNTTNQQEILSVSWGIRKGNTADPPFINVNGVTGRVDFNDDLDDTIKTRVAYRGDLKKGIAWFVLRNLTTNDAKEYIASISDNVTRLPYPVRLVVTQRSGKVSTVKPTAGPSASTDTTAVSLSMTTAYSKTTISPNITTPEPSSTNTIRHINEHLMLMTIALVMSHF